MALATKCASESAFASNKAELLNSIDSRFKFAANAFNGAENEEIKAINNGGDGDDKDSPQQDETNGFIKPDGKSSEMVCYSSATGKVVAANSPIVGTDYNSGKAKQINAELAKSTTGKTDFIYSETVNEPNTGKTTTENMLVVAWNGEQLTGNKKSKLVCVVTAPAPDCMK